MDTLEQIVNAAAALGAARTIEALGLSAGEVSQRQVLKTWGKWGADAIRQGRLRPSRIDNGAHGTKHYRVVEIQELKTADLVRAELQLTGRKTL